jgi:hypothetical protein
MVLRCDLEECANHFEIKIYPRQYVYPKYCPSHRNEYKRVRHLQGIGREDLIEEMKMQSESGEIETIMSNVVERSDLTDKRKVAAS